MSSWNALPKTIAQICLSFSNYIADTPSVTIYSFKLLQPNGAFFFVFFLCFLLVQYLAELHSVAGCD